MAVAGDSATALWLLAQMQPAAQGSVLKTLDNRVPLPPGPAPAVDDGCTHVARAPGDAQRPERLPDSRDGRPRRERGAESESGPDLYGTERREAARLTRRWRSAARRAAVAYAGRNWGLGIRDNSLTPGQLSHACCYMPALGPGCVILSSSIGFARLVVAGCEHACKGSCHAVEAAAER